MAKKRIHTPKGKKKIQRNREYPFPENQEEGISPETVYKYVGKPYKWWWNIVKPVRKHFVVAVILTAISMSLSTSVPKIIGIFIDDVYETGDKSKILYYGLLIVAIPVFRSVIGLLYRYLYEYSSQNTLMRLRHGIYSHLQNMDQPFYDKTSVGDIMSRMTGDIDMVRHYTAYVLMAMIEQILLFIVGLFLMFSLNRILALTTLALAPMIVVTANKFRKEIRPVWSSVRQSFTELNANVQQNIAGNRVVKSFVREDYEIDKFEDYNDKYRKINFKSVSVWMKYIPVLDGMSGLLSIPTILLGSMFVIQGTLSLGSFIAFNSIIFVVSSPMRMLGGLLNEMQRYAASAEKIIELLNSRSRITLSDKPQDFPHDVPAGEPILEFEDVSFRYGEILSEESRKSKENIILKNISFRINEGEKLGIIGATGSGKSTIVNLIARFYDPVSGKVKIYGNNVKEYNPKDLRKKLGIVFQEVFLFSDTIEGNIAYGNQDAPFEEITNWAKVAEAHEFIQKMTDGYETIVGERGVGLSGGQRQRISLARALCYDPEIIILDDTTSAIDMETELKIQNNLDKYTKGKTLITIAHRISSVRDSDLILVMDSGEIAERGTHEELIKKKGIYYDVYQTQTGLIDE